jgi:ribose transport system substrate-binding protein
MKYNHSKMRRRMALTGAAAFSVFAIAGCSVVSDVPSSDGAATSGECAGADGDYLIAMSQANVAEPYRQQMDDDIRAAAKEYPNFDVVFADAAQDNAKQVTDVNNFLTQGIDLLIISPNEATPLTSVVKQAYDAGVPVILLDRKVDGDAYTTFIGGDNTQMGEEAGRYVAEELLPDGGNVVELKGLAGSTPAQERSDGFDSSVAANPDVKVSATADGDWLREKGQSQMEALLQANPDIDVVYSHNDPMAEGAYLAAKAAGRDGDIKFIGMDGLPIPAGGIQAVIDGRLAATLVYPTGGREAIAAANTLLNECGTVEKEQVLKTELVTPDNAAEVLKQNSTAD